MYKWLLFDADGTLFDFATAETKALANTFEQFGLNPTQKTLQTFTAKSIHKFGAHWSVAIIHQTHYAAPAFNACLTRLVYKLTPIPASVTRILYHLGNCGDLIDGAEQLINIGKQTTIDWPSSQMDYLMCSIHGWRHHPLKPYFETVTISDEVGAAKPDGRIFSTSPLPAMGNPEKGNVMIIGDSL